MAFFFTCGTHTFNSLLQGYENIQAQCQVCYSVATTNISTND